ncbi:MAG: serine hydrolase [Pseudomonadota bacterium]
MRTRIAVLAIAAATLAGAAQAAPRAPCLNEPASAAARSPQCARPNSAMPFLDTAISQLPARIEKYLRTSHVPGLAIAVVHGGKQVYSQGFGVADINTAAKVDADTVFQLASISKPLGSTVISTQISAGKVAWNTPIRDVLPWFVLGTGSSSGNWVSQNVSIGDMYAHRSGLPDHAGDDLEGLGYDRSAILRQLRYLPLAPFRSSYAYTNYGIGAAAEAVASKAGVPWSQLADEAVYKPLGMTRTTSNYKTYISFPNHAVGHSPVDDDIDGTWRVSPEQADLDRATSSGGVASSANDMARWMLMLLAGGKTPDGKQLIDSAVLRDSMSAHNILPLSPDATLTTNSNFYGYGFSTGQTSNGLKFAAHNGALGQGASTNFMVIPALDLGIVVLTNGFPVGLPETVTNDFLELAQFGEVRTDAWDANRTAFRTAIKAAFGSSAVSGNPPTNAKPAKALDQYAGTYRNDYFGDALLTVVNNALQLRMGPAGGGMTWTLTHWNGDVFKLRQGTMDTSQSAVSAITFDLSKPKATLTDEYYQGTSHGLGVFTRAE